MRNLFILGRRGIWTIPFLLFICSLGCASAGNSITLFPEGHPMIDTAKNLRVSGNIPLPRELDKHPLEVYIVEPGDGLLLVPMELDSPIRLPSDQTVLPDGTIDLGKYGRLEVAGKSVLEIEAMVNHAVLSKMTEKTKETQLVDVRLVNRASKVYYVFGEVNSPGSFPLQGRETVLDGIVSAGGLNGKASRRNITLVRPSEPDACRTVLAVCYPEIVQLGDTTTNYQLRPGDRIYVPTRGLGEGCRSKSQSPGCNSPQRPCALGACATSSNGIAPVGYQQLTSPMPGILIKTAP